MCRERKRKRIYGRMNKEVGVEEEGGEEGINFLKGKKNFSNIKGDFF